MLYRNQGLTPEGQQEKMAFKQESLSWTVDTQRRSLLLTAEWVLAEKKGTQEKRKDR